MNNYKILWTLLFLYGYTLGVLRGQDGPLEIVDYSKETIVKEKEPFHLYCSANMKYSICKFTLPGGTVCQLKGGESEKECGAGARFNRENPNVCGIDVMEASRDFDGSFECEVVAFDNEDGGNVISQRKELNVVVSYPADVEFVDIYGSVTVIVDQPNNFTCTASFGQPTGSFIWRLGEENDESAIVFDNESPMNVVKDENGFLAVSQSFWYNPKIEHNAKNMYCIYEQKDHDGKVIFSNSDHIAFDVYYLNEPESATVIPEPEIGKDFHVTFIFGAYPKPKVEDIVWSIKGEDDIDIELKAKNPWDPSEFLDGKYTLDPLKEMGDQKYSVGFTVHNITEEDIERSYDVKISNRKKHSNDLILSTVHSFLIKPSSPDVGSATSITAIVIAIMLILVLISLLTLLILTYKYKKWCFAPKDPPNKPGYDGDVEQPLNDLNDTQIGGSSIVKPRS